MLVLPRIAPWPESEVFGALGAGTFTVAAADWPEARVPPPPSPRRARTVNPTRCPPALAGTARVALHEPPRHALSARTVPTLPFLLVEIW
nr:hypothetical protein GCM10020093_080950 [Planobispora longispora]